MKQRFSLVVVSLLFVLLVPLSIHASDMFSQSALQHALQTEVNYDLPYSGLLPDNPLYAFKTLRDRIVSFFITDAQKQAQFDLLQADKRLVAAQDLFKEPHHNDMLISQTLSKGENYFDESITNIAQAQKEGRLVNDFLDKLSQASLKHQQILYSMLQQSHGQLREDIGQEIERVQKFAERVNALKPH